MTPADPQTSPPHRIRRFLRVHAAQATQQRHSARK